MIKMLSPDKKIKKEIIKAGEFGSKPTENAICTIEICDAKFKTNQMPSEYLVEQEKYPIFINIGEANTALDREIEKCLQMMYPQELSSFVLNFTDNEVSFELKLCHFESQGYIYEWAAEDKFLLAQKHKEKGIDLFRENRFIDASHRFSKAIKLLLSIPISVENPPEEVDGVEIAEIEKLKANLYNNLASCYSKVRRYETVIELCSKVLEIDRNNVKALHKRGFAYSETRAFEKARDDLTKVLTLDAENQGAKEKLQYVNSNISQQEADFASMVKKMFGK